MEVIKKNFFKKKLNKKNNWLITGVAGFIGSNLARVLLECDQKVIGIDNFITGKKNNIQNFLNKKNFIFLNKNILNLKYEHLNKYNIDYVVHLAALSSVHQSFKKKNIFYKNNVEGFRNIKQISLKKNVKKFIYASSSSVYGNSKFTNLETQKLLPLSPYASTKLINEKDADKKNTIGRTIFVGLRLFNIFGKNQDFNSPYSAVLIKWINLLKKGKKIEIYGNGKNLRDFCHVDNVIYGIILITEKNFKKNKIYNIGSGKSISLNDLADILIKNIVGKNNRNNMIKYTKSKKGDIFFSKASLLKVKKEINFLPIFQLEKEIKKL